MRRWKEFNAPAPFAAAAHMAGIAAQPQQPLALVPPPPAALSARTASPPRPAALAQRPVVATAHPPALPSAAATPASVSPDDRPARAAQPPISQLSQQPVRAEAQADQHSHVQVSASHWQLQWFEDRGCLAVHLARQVGGGARRASGRSHPGHIASLVLAKKDQCHTPFRGRKEERGRNSRTRIARAGACTGA
jgi:hypothetical protein